MRETCGQALGGWSVCGLSHFVGLSHESFNARQDTHCVEFKGYVHVCLFCGNRTEVEVAPFCRFRPWLMFRQNSPNMLYVAVIAPKALAEGACILGEMGFCY